MEDSFYGDSIIYLEGAIDNMLAKIEIIRKYTKMQGEDDPISYIVSRVKTEESMKEKLKRRGFEVTLENALTKVYDAVGIRIICPYIQDVYTVAEMIKKCRGVSTFQEKDYIKNPKPNGYRSFHLIISLNLDIAGYEKPVYVEIQLRTIAMDFWSSLEHEIKYKKNIKNTEIIVKELKSCADLIATTDLNMQTIKNMINQD